MRIHCILILHLVVGKITVVVSSGQNSLIS